MRTLYTLNIHRFGAKNKLTAKRLVQLATIDGARDLGFADKTGSLTPGKRADLILIRTTDINLSQAGDPYEGLVTMGQPDNIDTVVVDGRILRPQESVHGARFRESQPRRRRFGGGPQGQSQLDVSGRI